MNPPRYGQAEPRVSFPPPVRSRTAALSPVPDPRFRDQLTKALLLGSGGRQYWDPEELRDIVDDLAPLAEARESALRHQLDTALGLLEIHREAADRHAAEVEARVQAAAPLLAKLRAVEELAEALDDEAMYGEGGTQRRDAADRIRRALDAS